MKLSLRTFPALVQDMAAATQAASQQVLDLTVGSTLRAILEASASAALWMQWLILQVLQMTRAATSNGTDLDSWMADFGLSRLPATCATGVVTFSRVNPNLPALIPPGTLIRTTDAAQTFSVAVDTTNAFWDSVQSGYSLAPGVASANIPVIANEPGSTGNVQAGTVSMIASGLAGIDTVLNSGPFTDGLNAETDSAFRARFQAYIASRSRATGNAVGYAISGIQQGLSYTIAENVDASGAPKLGSFVVTVDDGSGVPSQALLSAIYAAIDTVRPLGATFTLRPPVVLEVTVSMTLVAASGSDRNATIGDVVSAVSSYINALPVGGRLALTRIGQLAYNATTSAVVISGVLLNGQADDLTPSMSEVIRFSAMTVN